MLSGDSVPASTILPIILNKLGIPLQKKPPPPPTPKSEQEVLEEENEELKDENEPLKNEEAELLSIKEEEDDEKIVENEEDHVNNEENKENPDEVVEIAEREPTPPIVYEDLPLNEIVLKPGPDGNPRLQGFVMIGFPFNEEEANALKEFNIEFDKVLQFVDPSDGEILIKRGLEDFADLSKEIAAVDQAVSVCKDAFSDEILVEVPINGTEDEIHDRICRSIDPFYVYIDDPELILTKEELGEEAVGTTFGEYGPYDPVILKDHKWLMQGSEEYQVESLGKKYLFVSETEMEKFKKTPKQYINIAPEEVPQPHIMITGPRGSGVKTVLNELCEKYQIDSLDLKTKYLEYLEQEKYKRRKARLLKRGFLPRETNDDEEPYDPIEHDPDIIEEDESFDKALNEKNSMQLVLKGDQPLIINSRWLEIDEEKVSTGLVDLLYESRRLPEVIIILRAPESITIERLLDKEGITNKYQELMEIRRKEKEKAREEARKEKRDARLERIAAGEEVEDEEEEIEEETEDPEAPNLETMLEEAKQKIIETRESDNSSIDEIKEAFESRGIKIIEISSEINFSRLLQKINYELNKTLTNRKTIIERNLPVKLKTSKANELLLKSKAKISCFGTLCPVTPELPISKEYPVLFRDRVYYPGSPLDQEKFVGNPWEYLSQETNPEDVDLRVFCAIIGGPCSGKSVLSKDLVNALGIVRIGLRSAVSDILKQKSELAERVREDLNNGKELDEDLQVDVIA